MGDYEMLAFYLFGFVFSLVVLNRGLRGVSPMWEQVWAATIWPITLPGYVRSTEGYENVINNIDHAMKMDNGFGYKTMIYCTLVILGGLVYSVLLAFI
jgi:hypothetical protein